MRYIKGSRDLATFMPRAGKPDSIEAYLDGDWACDDVDRKSASGGYLMVGGCRLHSRSRTTGQHADVARAFCHKRGVGTMKQLDVKHCWLQEELQSENHSVKRVDRKFNASDMLTHSPFAEELRKFLPMNGCHTMTVMKDNFNAIKIMLKAMPSAKETAFLASTAEAMNL